MPYKLIKNIQAILNMVKNGIAQELGQLTYDLL